MTATSEQKTVVFSGVFALVWIGEAVVTMQIKLLGGNMSVFNYHLALIQLLTCTPVHSSSPSA